MTIEMASQGTDTAPAIGLTSYVAAEIRAYLGRHSISKAELARRLSVAETWVGKRLNERTEITLTDLEHIATALGTRPSTFLPRADDGLLPGSPGKLPASKKRHPIDPLAPRVVAVGGHPRKTTTTGPLRATRTHGRAAPIRPLAPAVV